MIRFSVPEYSCKNSPVISSGFVGGHEYAVCPDYLLKDGKPYIYRMGEFQYSRYPAEDWERELKKMKDGGIEIVSSYVFWIHHEPVEGVFNFSGSCDIRRFIDTCEALGMTFWLRIGPWIHGEARNGGFPDWLEKKCDAVRCIAEPYLSYVRRFFTEFYQQVKGSRNIIGIQVENEMTEDAAYMACIRDMLREIGFSAPYWSATAWGCADLPEGLLPMFGGYPEAPWMEHVHELGDEGSANFFFSHQRDDGVIGADLLDYSRGTVAEDRYKGKYPFLTCEMGGGIPTSYHRRSLIPPEDIGALAICRLGSGANGMGYYVYHGGRNPMVQGENGEIITTQESRETGYLNDYPRISYDFQAPLGDCGQVRSSYHVLKNINRFLNTVGQTLASMGTFFPEQMPADLDDTTTPRVAVRSDGKSGFLFFNNHKHLDVLCPKTDTVSLQLSDGTLEIPLSMPSGSYGVIPFRFPIGTETVQWVKALPVEQAENRMVFAMLPGIEPTVCFADGTRKDLREVSAIGGLPICVEEDAKKPEQTAMGVPYEKVPNRMDFSAFGHILPQWTGKLIDRTAEYAVKVPKEASYLLVQAQGNIGCCYDAAGKLLSDHYLDGGTWVIDVRNISEVLIKIQPLTEHDAAGIYFETEMSLGEIPPIITAVIGDTVCI